MAQVVRTALVGGGVALAATTTSLVLLATVFKGPDAVQAMSHAVRRSLPARPLGPLALASAPEAQGWEPTARGGVYWRWCSEGECSSDEVARDNGFVLMKVWCKDALCGDIYGRVNLLDSRKRVVGWTNDTGYGKRGQMVLLTFDSPREFHSAQVTDLSFSD